MSGAGLPALDAAVTSIALCWRICRPDGVALGLTCHDRDLVVDGLLYRARPGLTPSAVRQALEQDGDRMAVEGLLDADGLTASDLAAGRWNGAEAELFACDWAAAEPGRLVLLKGRLGIVSHGFPDASGGFRAEIRSSQAALDEQRRARLSPTCRADLGDARCGVDMAGRRIELEANGWDDRRILLSGLPPDPDAYAGGRLRVVSGRLTGLDRRVVRLEEGAILMEDGLPGREAAAFRVWLWEGCDKRFETCAARFSNAVMFDGEPHVPGTDALLRYGDS